MFPQLLTPKYTRRYALFARNRIVLAYMERSRRKEINATNWRSIITRRGIAVGRAGRNTDPSGYPTLLSMQLAVH